MTTVMEKLTFTVPLTRKILEQAKRFSQQQKDQDKAKQIYLNTIAILAVAYYCELMELETDLEASESWNIVTQTLMDVADLEIIGIGKLECRPVYPHAEICRIPQEVWEDRIGFVIVEINENNLEAKLLGFVKEVNREQILVGNLKSLEELINVLYDVEPVINLSEWFKQIFGNGWQPEERALTLGINRAIKSSEQPEVNGAKVIRLGMQMSQETVVLILRQKQLNETELEVNLRLYPSADTMYLPNGVKLEVLDETGTPIPTLEVQASADNWIQLKFTAEQEDKFSVQVSLEESSIIEHFLL